jgi:cobalt/nickel transport system permease protein
MHIPDGYLGPKTFITAYVLMAPFWWRAWVVLKRNLRTLEVPMVALAAAFIFVMMMFNVPIPGGTTGHAVGASAVAIALGAWPAVLAVSFALILQALLFGDGGVTAIAANCLNMAVLQVFVSVWVWNVMRPRDVRSSRSRVFWAGFGAGYLGLLAAAVGTAVMFGLQPVLERAADGTPLYSPFPLRVAVPAMFFSHLLISVLEGVITGFMLQALARRSDTIVTGSQLAPAPAMLRRPAFWVVSVLVVLAVPVGLYLPELTGAGAAWGEWAPEDAAARAGLASVPAGMARLAQIWKAPLPDYTVGEGARASEGLQYVATAVVGIAVITLVFMGLGKWQRTRMRKMAEGHE